MNTVQVKFILDDELISKTPNSLLNRSADNENLQQMKEWLNMFGSVHYSTGYSESELQQIEEMLGLKIPPTLRMVYAYTGKDNNLLTPGKLKNTNYKILKPDELLVEKNVIVHDSYSGEAWYETDVLVYMVTHNGKQAYNGIDMKRDWQLSFYKQWYWQKDSMPLYKELLVTLVCTAISRMQNIFKTKVKEVTGWEIYKRAEKKFEGYFERFSDFEHYDHTLFYNQQRKALGWFRAGSAIPDLLVGCDDKTFIDEFIAKMNMSKAKHHRIDGVVTKK